MRRVKQGALAALAAICLAAPAQAGNAEDVAAVMKSITEGLSTCNIDTFASVVDPEGTVFAPPAVPLHSGADDIAFWRDQCAKGGSAKVSFTTTKVELYGDTALLLGMHPKAEFKLHAGETVNWDFRVTIVARKTGGKWLIRHAHISPQVPPPPAQ